MDLIPINSMIDAGASPQELAGLFNDPKQAAVYYAHYMRQTHSYENAVSQSDCTTCAVRRPTRIAEFLWNAVWTKMSFGAANLMLLPLGIVSWNESGSAFGFDTHHALCEACWQRFKPKPFRHGLINFICISMIVIGLFGGGTGWTALFIMDMKRGETATWATIGAIGTAMLIIGVLGTWRFGRVHLPPSLKRFARKPFSYYSAVLVTGAPAAEADPMNDLTAQAVRDSALTWQMTLVVLSVVSALIFAFLRFAHDIPPKVRHIGLNGLLGSVAAFVLFLVWHFRAKSRTKREQ